MVLGENTVICWSDYSAVGSEFVSFMDMYKTGSGTRLWLVLAEGFRVSVSVRVWVLFFIWTE